MLKKFLLLALLCTASSKPAQYNIQIPVDFKIISNSAAGTIAGALLLVAGKKLYQKYYISTPVAEKKKQIGIFEIGDLSAGATKYMGQIEKAMYDDNIVGLLLKINSGGGHAGTSEVIFRELKIIKQKKPIVVFIENVCCSGGYLIASTGKIVAPHMAEVGSIGVLCAIEKIKEPKSSKKEDLTVDFVFAGADKVFRNPYAPDASPEQRQKMQAQVDLDYDFFCSAIAQERGISLDDKDKWADAQTFVAPDALKLGLIDQVGGFNDAKVLIINLVKKALEDPKLATEFTEIK
ncbi:MAG TPA: S49 family peptidase [Candidatus Babeliales bacterium]|nr:S49 family peptidase [Candidatus Babeliales bacterium]